MTATATYIATDDETDDQICTVFGMTFEKGKPEKVTEAVAKKLAGNRTFKVEHKAARG